MKDLGRAIVEATQKTEQGGERDILHADLYDEWMDKEKHYESLPDDSPQKHGAQLNMSYARATWETAVLASAEKALMKE